MSTLTTSPAQRQAGAAVPRPPWVCVLLLRDGGVAVSLPYDDVETATQVGRHSLLDEDVRSYIVLRLGSCCRPGDGGSHP